MFARRNTIATRLLGGRANRTNCASVPKAFMSTSMAESVTDDEYIDSVYV